MHLILLLVLVPILCISITVYILTLVSFISTTNLDTITLLITIFINVFITHFLPKILLKCFDDSIALLNRKKIFYLIHSYIAFLFITLFGVALVINSIITQLNIIYLVVGIIIILMFIYVTINQFFYVKLHDFILKDIINIKKYVYCLILKDENDNEYEVYVSNKDNYKILNKYQCKYNAKTKRIHRIIKGIEG